MLRNSFYSVTFFSSLHNIIYSCLQCINAIVYSKIFTLLNIQMLLYIVTFTLLHIVTLI